MAAETERLSATCHQCNEIHSVTVPYQRMRQYVKGRMLVQEAFPYLTRNQREIVMQHRGFPSITNGYLCPDCWDKWLEQDEEEQYLPGPAPHANHNDPNRVLGGNEAIAHVMATRRQLERHGQRWNDQKGKHQ